ncbi:MAG: type 4a pilus biogenesis protein PilO [Candidatus Wallbacteria bacterium]|nr:type 4a pilus biogenesis protein PilO [Candidatus Wallbacteria bacterium]
MKNDKLILGGFSGIFILIFCYLSFFLLPLNSDIRKVKSNSDNNRRQFETTQEELKRFDIPDLNSKIETLKKKLKSFEEYKIERKDIPVLLDKITQIASKPRMKIYLNSIKQGGIQKNEKISEASDKPSPPKPVSSSSEQSAPPPPPPPGSGSTPPSPSGASSVPNQRLTVQQPGTQKTPDKITWLELPIFIEMSGEFIDIAKFFFYLNQIENIIIVDSLSLDTDSMNTGAIECKLKLVVVMGESNE